MKHSSKYQNMTLEDIHRDIDCRLEAQKIQSQFQGITVKGIGRVLYGAYTEIQGVDYLKGSVPWANLRGWFRE